MTELSRLRGSEGYGACDDEIFTRFREPAENKRARPHGRARADCEGILRRNGAQKSKDFCLAVLAQNARRTPGYCTAASALYARQTFRTLWRHSARRNGAPKKHREKEIPLRGPANCRIATPKKSFYCERKKMK